MSSRPLIVVGAGGHGRETVLAYRQAWPDRELLGFLDDHATGTTPEGWPVLGRVGDWPMHREACFLVAVNAPRARRRVTMAMRQAGEPEWLTLVHPDVAVHPSCRIGAGSMILSGACLTVSIDLGEFTIVNRGVQIGHDSRIGAYSSLNPGAVVSGRVSIGAGVETGSASCIRQGISVGDGATIGMGAVVVKNVPGNAIVAGNPARHLRENEPW